MSTQLCDRCGNVVVTKPTEAGGFWHLSGWINPHGIAFSGGYCPPCYDAIHHVKKFETTIRGVAKKEKSP